jgi:hypothetical protein
MITVDEWISVRGVPITNFVHKARRAEELWIQETTSKIGDWRSVTRSTYIRWALCINGLLLAARNYVEWEPDRQFKINALRVQDKKPELAPIAIWTGKEAAENHERTAELVAAYGMLDLFGALEEILFQAYRIFLEHHPSTLLKGAEQKGLRQLYYAQRRNPALSEEWLVAWRERLDSWQKRRVYDGLGKVFKAYFRDADLKRPSFFEMTTIDHWAETISGIAELRRLCWQNFPESRMR